MALRLPSELLHYVSRFALREALCLARSCTRLWGANERNRALVRDALRRCGASRVWARYAWAGAPECVLHGHFAGFVAAAGSLVVRTRENFFLLYQRDAAARWVIRSVRGIAAQGIGKLSPDGSLFLAAIRDSSCLAYTLDKGSFELSDVDCGSWSSYNPLAGRVVGVRPKSDKLSSLDLRTGAETTSTFNVRWFSQATEHVHVSKVNDMQVVMRHDGTELFSLPNWRSLRVAGPYAVTLRATVRELPVASVFDTRTGAWRDVALDIPAHLSCPSHAVSESHIAYIVDAWLHVCRLSDGRCVHTQRVRSGAGTLFFADGTLFMDTRGNPGGDSNALWAIRIE